MSDKTLIPTGMAVSLPTRLIIQAAKTDLRAEKQSELQSAIDERGSSPTPRKDDGKVQVDVRDFTASARLSLSEAIRKISHQQSLTDSKIIFDSCKIHVGPPASLIEQNPGDNKSDGTPKSLPSMVRKQSGQRVRPALRQMSNRRPSSMPGTTCSKAVQFDLHLEYVQHFFRLDRPLAVRAGSSLVDQYGSQNEFSPGSIVPDSRSGTPLYKWEIKISNFPYQDVDSKKDYPVHSESMYLSSDDTTLMGSVAVQNLAFQKTVVCRFTFDSWETISEVIAAYDYNIHHTQQNDDLDRFHFSISPADQVRSEKIPMLFCIRYRVNGQDYWDSNNGCNYQVDFLKRPKLQNGRNNDSATSIPSMSFGEPARLFLGEHKLNFRTPSATARTLQDAPQHRSHKESRNFRARYDLNSSLAATKNGAYTLPD